MRTVISFLVLATVCFSSSSPDAFARSKNDELVGLQLNCQYQSKIWPEQKTTYSFIQAGGQYKVLVHTQGSKETAFRTANYTAITDNGVWISDQDGVIYDLTKPSEVTRQFEQCQLNSEGVVEFCEVVTENCTLTAQHHSRGPVEALTQLENDSTTNLADLIHRAPKSRCGTASALCARPTYPACVKNIEGGYRWVCLP